MKVKKYLLALLLLSFTISVEAGRRHYKRSATTTPSPTQTAPPTLQAPSIDDRELNSNVKILVGYLIAFGFVISVIRLFDSAFLNQWNDIDVKHQLVAVGTFFLGFLIIPELVNLLFQMPDIIPFGN